MPGYLNVDAIENAAELVNTTLQSKGYLSEQLLFPTIDWEKLTEDQPHAEQLRQLETQETVYNNDKNVINIIYSLCQSIDRHNAQHKQFNRTLLQKESTIEDLQRRLDLAEHKASSLEDRLARVTQVDHVTLQEQNRRLNHTNRVQAQEVARLRSWSAELQGKYDVEMRRKDVQISELKDKLLDTRKLSTTITYGKPVDSGPLSPQLSGEIDTNAGIVHGGKAVSNNSTESRLDTNNPAAKELSASEYDGIATQLAELIENLIAENSKYAGFVNELNEYVGTLNGAISPSSIRNVATTRIQNPSDYIDMARITSSTSVDIEPFETVSRPLLSAVYSHYHSLIALVDALAASGGSEDGENRKTIEQLTEENKMLSKNWQDAMKALEEWKSYKR